MTHLLRYLLIFGDRKKKVELSVGEELENVKVETLKRKARELFNLKNVLLQIWDKGFEDWVDLDEGDPTPTNSRIKVEVDKEAKSLSDMNIAKRMPSSSAAAKSLMLATTPKVDPPFVQVLSSHSSHPPIAVTSTEVPLALPTQKSLPALSRLPQPHSKSVLSKLSSGTPQRTLPVGQRQPQASSSVGKPILDLEDSTSHIPTSACHQPYPTASSHSQPRPVVDYIQQSFSSPSRIPGRTVSTSQEDVPQRLTILHSQNKPAMEVLQQSSQVPYAWSSRIPERPLPCSQENLSHRPITSCSQNKQTYMQSLRIPERSLPPSQDIAPYRHMIAQHVQNTPEVQQVVQESCTSLPFSQTLSIPENTLSPSLDPSLHLPTTTRSKNKPDGPVVQESCSSQPYPQTSKIPQRHLPPSGDIVHPIVIEDELSSNKGNEEEEQMKDITCTSSLEHDKLSLYDYKLPNFPADIIHKLENGIPIEAKDRSVLLDTLYESVVQYTYYPSSSDYNYLTKSFLERFPQLIPQAGPIRDCSDNWEAWRQKLMYKFKNKRKRKDRDAPGVIQHKHMNCKKHFEGLDEFQSASGQVPRDRGDLVDSDCPGEAKNDDVFEVVDDEQDVMTKDEDSMYHVVAADTTNVGDTAERGFSQESLTSPPYFQSSRTQEIIVPPFQDHQTHRSNTLQSQSDRAMECVQESLSSPPHMQSSRVLERSLSSQDDVSYQQTTALLQKKAIMEVVQESGSSKSYLQTSRFPGRSLMPSQDSSEGKAPYQQTVPYSQTQTVMEVEQQSSSLMCYRQTSKISESALHFSRDDAPAVIVDEDLSCSPGQEERLMEAQHINSAFCDSDKPSLYNYKLPKFPADIIQKLENGIPIEAKDRSVLLDTLYESVVPYTYYPSAADYIYLTNIFLEQYPQLLPQAGAIRDCPDNWEAWRQKMMHKFKNKRKRKDRDAPAVREHTRKNFRYFEGLDELQSSSGQAQNERGDLVDSDYPGEADDEVFEVVDDDQDVLIKEEHSAYHVMAADTTNLSDTSVKRGVHESSPYIQYPWIPEGNLPLSQDDAPFQPPTLHSQKKPVPQIAQEFRSSETYLQTSRLQERTLIPSQELAPPPIVEEDLLPSTSQREKQTEVQHKESSPSMASDQPSLYDYKLPKFPDDIIQKLERGVAIETRDRSVLLDTLYESIVPYTYYPSASDYIYFTNIFLERFPQLLPQAGPIRDCSDNWEAWRQKLMHKFKNKRKRKDRDAPAVREHTRKNFRYFEGLDELQSSNPQALNERGDPMDSDCPGEADDEVSMYHVMAADTTNLGDT